MLAYRDSARIILLRVGSPDLDSKVGRARDERGIIMGEGNIVDPVHMGVCLGAELGRVLGLFVVLLFVRGGGRVDDIAAAFEVEVQIPSAYNAVSATRVTERNMILVPGLEVAGGLRGESSQNGVVSVDREAIDTKSMAASGGFGVLEDCSAC